MPKENLGGDGLGSDVKRVVGVRTDREQRWDSVRSKAGQSRDGCGSRAWPVGIVHEAAQVIERWHGLFPQDVKREVSSIGEALSFCLHYALGESVRCERRAIEQVGKCNSQWRGLVLNPFDEEGESGGSDVVDCIGCFLVLSGRYDIVLSQRSHPEAKWLSAVGRFAGSWIVCEQGDEGQQRTSGADEKRSLLSHARDYATKGGE